MRTASARLDRAREGRKPTASAPFSAPAPPARPASAPARARRPHYVRSPHIPLPQLTIGGTKRLHEWSGPLGSDSFMRRF